MISTAKTQLTNEIFQHYKLYEPEPDFYDAWNALLQPLLVDQAQPIVRANTDQKHFYILKEGLVRYYYTSPEGKEWNKAFFSGPHIIGSLSAYLTHAPCRFTIEAIEPCSLFSIPTENFRLLTKKFTQAQQLIQAIEQEMFLRNELRENILLTGNAEQRYLWLENNEPWLLNRKVPQYHLASYLGMDAVSLSRVKRKLRR